MSTRTLTPKRATREITVTVDSRPRQEIIVPVRLVATKSKTRQFEVSVRREHRKPIRL